MEMIGEMNASHTGISAGGQLPGRANQQERVQTRYPGFEMEPDSSGFYKVSSIFRKGPADHEYVKLAVGNYVLALNDKELKTSENYWKLFNILPGRKFEFLVNSKPSTDGAWIVLSIRLPPPRRATSSTTAGWTTARPPSNNSPTARSAICTSRPWMRLRWRNSSSTCGEPG